MRNARKTEIPGDPWVLKDIRALLDLLIEREITEFEMEKDGFRVRVRRGVVQELVQPAVMASPAIVTPVVQPAAVHTAAHVPPAREGEPAHSPNPPPTPSPEAAEAPHIIKSPIVGTFYQASAPDAEPFVKLGDVVQAGQVLCVIEAMKLMNEIESEVAGEVIALYVENAQPVEYGQPLFAIKKP